MKQHTSKGNGGPTKIVYCHSSTASGRKALPADVSVGIRQSLVMALPNMMAPLPWYLYVHVPVMPDVPNNAGMLRFQLFSAGSRNRRLKWKSS